MSGERREPLQRYPNRTIAEVARARLEAVDIPAWVESDDVGGQYPGIESRRGARLYVDPENEASARALLGSEVGADDEVQLRPDELGPEITAAAEAAVGRPGRAPLGLVAGFLVVVALLAWWVSEA